MARVKRGTVKRRKHNAVRKLVKGHYSVRHRHYRRAKEGLLHAMRYAYVHRRERKRDFRRLWVLRISAGAKSLGLNYSTFMHGLKEAGVDVNRKVLADIAVREPETFAQLAEKARGALAPA